MEPLAITPNNTLAVAFAFASALSIAWGTVIRHRVALTSGTNRTGAIVDAIRLPVWWAGLSAAFLGYFLQIIALSYGTLLIVQPILVLSLMLTLPLSSLYDRRRLSKRELFWAGILTIAVGVIVIYGSPLPGHQEPELDTWLSCLSVGAAVLTVIYMVARRLHGTWRGVLLGGTTGAIMGYVAVLSKAVVDIYTTTGLVGLVSSWELYSLIAGAVIGTSVQQASFNAGALKTSLPAMTVVEPLVAFALGYAVLKEYFDVHGWGWLLMAGATAIMLFATVVLSRLTAHPSTPEDAGLAESGVGNK